MVAEAMGMIEAVSVNGMEAGKAQITGFVTLPTLRTKERTGSDSMDGNAVYF